MIPLIEATDSHIDFYEAKLNDKTYQSGTVIISEGTYTLEVYAIDKAGNESNHSIAFEIDKTPPDITINGIEEGYTYNQILTPEIYVNDINLDNYEAFLNSNYYLSGTSIENENNYSLSVYARDKAGNLAEKRINFEIDTTAPEIDVHVPKNDFYYNSIVSPWLFNEDEIYTYEAFADGVSFYFNRSGNEIRNEGFHTIEVTAMDEVGNTSSLTIPFNIDLTNPLIEITGVTDEGIYDSDVTVNFVSSDTNLNDDGAWIIDQPFSDPRNISEEGEYYGRKILAQSTFTVEGSYWLGVEARDKARNTTRSISSFSIDKSPPAITVSGVKNEEIYGVDVIPEVTVTDAHLLSYEARCNGISFNNGHEFTGEGRYQIAVNASDKAGNNSQLDVFFEIDRTKPEILITNIENNSIQNISVIPEIAITDLNLKTSELTLNGQPYVAGTPIVNAGKYTIEVNAVDRAENKSLETVSFEIEKAAPSVTISVKNLNSGKSIVYDGFSGGNTEIFVNVVDDNLSGFQTFLNNSRVIEGLNGNQQTFSRTVDGVYALTVEATDSAGNSSTQSFSFTIDSVRPEVTVSGVAENLSYNQPVTAVIAINDLNSGNSSALLNGLDYISGSQIVSEGDYVLKIQAEDLAGNLTEKTVNFKLDLQEPLISYSVYPSDYSLPTFYYDDEEKMRYYTDDVIVSVRYEDADLQTSSSSIDGIPFTNTVKTTTEGRHELLFAATDRAGNSSEKSQTFIVDKTNPQFSIEGLEMGSTRESKRIFNGPVSFNVSVIEDNLLTVLIL